MRADLHVHSHYSDGTATPKELMEEAKALGLGGLSITDHDSIAAYEEALALAKTYEMQVISGVEFSTLHEGESVHILGYSFSLQDPGILALCKRHKERRHKRNLQILANLEALGISLDRAQFSDIEKTWGRPHIAEALIQKGVVSSIQEAFDIYLAEGKKAYDPGESISAEETIAVIHQAGGFAILAHPHLIKKQRLVKSLLRLDFDGLEGYYARLPKKQEARWLALATERGWLITGGSDYHGTIKPYSKLGSSWVDEETFQLLYQRFCKSNPDQVRS